MARTDTLGHFLTDVADAIRTKKGSEDTIQASNFDTEIENLPSGGGKYQPRWLRFTYYAGTDLDYETQNLDTSLLTTMDNMFYGCQYLVSLDLSSFDFSSTTSMYTMFYSCGSRATEFTVNFGNTDVSNVNTLGGCFQSCSTLKHITMPNADITGNFSMVQCFQYCTALETADLSKIKILSGNGTIDVRWLFSGCSSLQKADIRNMDTSRFNYYTNMLDNVPTTCEIIVGTDTDKSWFATKYASYTNVKTVEEYEAE